mmetsp:Transcript_14480/g.24538  ORF Transcript_14480/g.24538 Transcript_14480/m.24538 type:complete len:267 (-) Transcript_14480:834-1634(-)
MVSVLKEGHHLDEPAVVVLHHQAAHLEGQLHQKLLLRIRLFGLTAEEGQDADARGLVEAQGLYPQLHFQHALLHDVLVHVRLRKQHHDIRRHRGQHQPAHNHPQDGEGPLGHTVGLNVPIADGGHSGEGPVSGGDVSLREGRHGLIGPGEGPLGDEKVQEPRGHGLILQPLLLIIGVPLVVGEEVEHAPEDVPEVDDQHYQLHIRHHAQQVEHIVLVFGVEAAKAHETQELDQSDEAQQLDDLDVLPGLTRPRLVAAPVVIERARV